MGTTAPARRRAARRGRQTARRVASSRVGRISARAGYLARLGFYLVLAGLVARVAYDGGTSGRQADVHGAMSVIAETVPGKVALAAAALGFALLGVERLAGAIRDRGATQRERAVTALQGAFYLAITWVPLSFLRGNSRTGSEQAQQQETTTILHWPAGREIVAVLGVALIVACGYQIRVAVTEEFT